MTTKPIDYRTGSFGALVLDRFISSELSEIRIFSRDEKKQDDLRESTIIRNLNFSLVMYETTQR